jgi:glycolate oxidase
METTFNLQCANVFHAGDGNLHPLIMFDANDDDQLHRAEQYGAAILELCVEVGGTITGEHGVGIEKITQMCVQFNPEELAQFRAVKQAFDPEELLNPGKGVPAPRHCSEYRTLPHPHSPPNTNS